MKDLNEGAKTNDTPNKVKVSAGRLLFWKHSVGASCLLAAASLLLGTTAINTQAFADAVTNAVSSTNEGSSSPKLLKAKVEGKLSETPVNQSSSDHFRSYEVAVTASLLLAESKTSYWENPRLSVLFRYTDEIGYEDNESNLENTTVYLPQVGMQLASDTKLSGQLIFSLPTNADARQYNSFRGLSRLRTLVSHIPALVNGLEVYSLVDIDYLFYEYDTTEFGNYNPQYSLVLLGGASYAIAKDWSASADFFNVSYQLYNGGRPDDSYGASLELTYHSTDALAHSLEWSKRDRTFGHNGITPEINFRYADATLVTIATSYSF